MKNKTEIFKNYTDFLRREDKEVNGVDAYFADQNPNWQEDNLKNQGCWNCSDCSRCSDCSDCSRCSDCSDCSLCSRCSGCSGCSDDKVAFDVPVIENIHAKILEAVSDPKHFDMGSWHSSCGTAHCRAGWAVHLTGKAGYDLEEKTSPIFAAMQIYKASSSIRVSPTRFFETDEAALADIKRCAEEEKSIVSNEPNPST